MDRNFRQKIMLRFFIVFFLVDVAAFAFAGWLDANKINHYVVIGANTLLLILAAISMMLQAKAAENPNPNVFVRSIMGGTFLKLMVIIVALVIYLYAAGPNRSIYAVFAGMGLYMVYTFVEVKGLLQLNSQKHGSN
ncbi:MAG TPA: hypothetical protein VG738_22945 [Chitinophagaceae bacterium]|nr:hypothetical protein [Chitinophagaceae bacterium]